MSNTLFPINMKLVFLTNTTINSIIVQSEKYEHTELQL